MKIPLLMYDALHYDLLAGYKKCYDSPFPSSLSFNDYIFANSATSLLGYLLQLLSLGRDDVISIVTTSDEQYVSSCLTLTAFNYASVSRKILPATRVAIVVHEHGYIRGDIKAYVDTLRHLNIFVIEDCAHVLGSNISEYVPGSCGDVSIFSLPKVLPLRSGGILITNTDRAKNLRLHRHMPDPPTFLVDAFNLYLPYWRSFNDAKYERHRLFSSSLGRAKVRHLQLTAPWLIYVYDSRLSDEFLSEIQCGASFLVNTLLIPANPLVPLSLYIQLLENLSPVIES
jgi:hypothetical protein